MVNSPDFNLQKCDNRRLFTMSEILSFRKDLFHDLRSELGHLKTCQTTLLVFTGAGSGIFFSLLREESYIPRQYLILMPLVFLLPLWIIFYEKARTIARIVGYLRVQEKLFMYRSSLAMVGWESAMKLYWERRRVWDKRVFDPLFKDWQNPEYNPYARNPVNPEEKAASSNISATSSIYWFTVFLTFLSLNMVCLILGFCFMPHDGSEKAGIIIAVIPTLIIWLCFLKLDKIGEKNKKSDERKPHTNIHTLSVKARFVSLCFMIFGMVSAIYFYQNIIIRSVSAIVLILSIISLIFTYYRYRLSIKEWKSSGEKEDIVKEYSTLNNQFLILIGILILIVCLYILLFLNQEHLYYLLSSNFISYLVYVIFFAAFLYCSSVASWMFLHLVKDRYNYGSFEKRWQIILDIFIDEDAKNVLPARWGDLVKAGDNNCQ